MLKLCSIQYTNFELKKGFNVIIKQNVCIIYSHIVSFINYQIDQLHLYHLGSFTQLLAEYISNK